jgi:hypothetical protein
MAGHGISLSENRIRPKMVQFRNWPRLSAALT